MVIFQLQYLVIFLVYSDYQTNDNLKITANESYDHHKQLFFSFTLNNASRITFINYYMFIVYFSYYKEK